MSNTPTLRSRARVTPGFAAFQQRPAWPPRELSATCEFVRIEKPAVLWSPTCWHRG